MNNYTSLIIDDEAIARQRLTRLIKDTCPQIEIIGEAKDGIEGAQLIDELKPDLIFLDVQMPGRTGLEMLQDIDHLPLVVFCTAYEEYALEAFNTLAIDYLVKPVEKDRLRLTMDKIQRSSNKPTSIEVDTLMELLKAKTKVKTMQSIPHKIGDRVILIKTEQITHLVASDKYVEFYTTDGSKYLTELSLKRLIEQLPKHFQQVHRSTLINTNFVKEYRKYFRGKFIIVLDNKQGTKIETGRSYTHQIKEILNI